MANGDEAKHVDTEQARAGETRHSVRYILAVSLILVIAIFAYLIMR